MVPVKREPSEGAVAGEDLSNTLPERAGMAGTYADSTDLEIIQLQQLTQQLQLNYQLKQKKELAETLLTIGDKLLDLEEQKRLLPGAEVLSLLDAARNVRRSVDKWEAAAGEVENDEACPQRPASSKELSEEHHEEVLVAKKGANNLGARPKKEQRARTDISQEKDERKSPPKEESKSFIKYDTFICWCCDKEPIAEVKLSKCGGCRKAWYC